MSSNKLNIRIFNLKLDNINSCVIPTTNKDEVEIQFNEPSDDNKDVDSLIQITFHFPSLKQQQELNKDKAKKTTPEGEEAEDAEDEDEEDKPSMAEAFQEQVIQVGVVPSVTGDIIVEFSKEQGNFVTPRGKYTLQVGLCGLLVSLVRLTMSA